MRALLHNLLLGRNSTGAHPAIEADIDALVAAVAERLTLAQHSAINHDGLIIDHAGLENVTANQHHNENHAARHDPGGADELTAFLRSTSPASPTRAFDTPFRPSLTRPTLCVYSVRVELTQITAEWGTVELRHGTSSPPTTVGPSVELSMPALSGNKRTTGNLVAIIPAGWWVSLQRVTLQGAPVYVLVNQTEYTL